MSALSAIAFAQPWLLLGLLGLPVIWWLLRAMPPAPERVTFPPARLLFDLVRTEETPVRTPWWLLLLRLVIAALIILGLAKPLLNPGAAFQASGPVVLIVDDGWAAAQHWRDRVATMTDLARRARREERPVMLVRTTRSPDGMAPKGELMSAEDALATIGGMVPRPWAPDRAAAEEALRQAPVASAANVFWLTDGLQSDADTALVETARRMGSLTVVGRDPAQTVMVVRPVESGGARLSVTVERDREGPAEPIAIRASGEDGQVLLRREARFPAGETTVKIDEVLPVEALNRISRIDLEGRESAGAVALVDAGLKRYRVGLSGNRAPERSQPLLSDLYYLERALKPFAEIREGETGQLMSEPLSMLVLPDIGNLVESDARRIGAWIEKGGVLVRFAGPRLAENVDDLVPVTLRQGGRSLQGTMSWAEPARLAPFGPGSPFRGLEVPDDVLIRQQVLAEPTVDLPDKTWARLEDGTPLVTAERRGDGWLVLVHTTANTAWSNLPLSGLFVEMLRRLSALSEGLEVKGEDRQLEPTALLDGFGRRVEPGSGARPLQEAKLDGLRVGPEHPPGLYGDPETGRALNVGGVAHLAPMDALPPELGRDQIGGEPERDVGPWLLALAAALLIADLLVALAIRGLLRPRRVAYLLPFVALAGMVPADPAAAQTEEGVAGVVEAALETRLAYVVTGDESVDRMSEAGMFGLSEILRARTSVEPVEAAAVDIESDDLIFYPLVYWPMVESQPELSDAAVKRLDRYLRTGGVVLFDTRDDGVPSIGRGQVGPGTAKLRSVLARIDIGPLEPVREGHVLTRAFYLSDSFPGRYSGGRVWIERLEANTNDGVSPLVIGGADWASAWAMDDSGRSIAALDAGGRRQRELAYRFGVNLVMYALTGNYKSDQVHLPAILERLGQ